MRFVTQHVTTILVVLLALLIAAIVPFGAWLSRRRARAAALDDADRVEAEWQSLLLRLQDIGFVPPDGATPRQASRTIGHDAYLTPDENDALGRVVTTLERARYARPGADLVDVTDDARTVWRGALSRRRRTDRARALLLPEEGKQMWRSLGRSLLFWRDRDPDVPPATDTGALSALGAEVAAPATTSALTTAVPSVEGVGRSERLGHLHAGRGVAERLVQPAG